MQKSFQATSRILLFPPACRRSGFRFSYDIASSSSPRLSSGMRIQHDRNRSVRHPWTTTVTRWKSTSTSISDSSTTATRFEDADNKEEKENRLLVGEEGKIEVEPSDVMDDNFAEQHPEVISINDLDTNEKEKVTPLLEKLRNGEKMVIGYTCTYAGPCHTNEEARRQYKIISKKSYYEGVCLVKCPCEKLHLIADNLGWFGEDRNIEEILARRGDKLRKLRLEDKFDVS